MRGWHADEPGHPEIESHPMTTPALTLEQKRDLYRDGYIVLENAVSDELVAARAPGSRPPRRTSVLVATGR